MFQTIAMKISLRDEGDLCFLKGGSRCRVGSAVENREFRERLAPLVDGQYLLASVD